MNTPVEPSADRGEESPSPDATPAPDRPLQILEGISLAYLVLPFAIFLLGWLRPVLALPSFLLLAAAAYYAYRDTARAPAPALDRSAWPIPGQRLAAMAAVVFAVVATTGIGGFAFQFFDYAFYDAVLKDFMTYSWPIAYEEAGPDNEPMHLVMYPAYWLPSAMVGHLAGWEAAYYSHYLWAGSGMLLILLWFLRIAQTSSMHAVLLVLFFGGLDLVGRLLTESPGEAQVSLFGYLAGEFWWSHGRGWLDHWSSSYALLDPEMAPKAGGVFFRFFSPISFLVDGPYHLFPAMIGFMMLLHDWWRRNSLGRSLLIWACLPICSVFVSAGSVPFLGLAILERRGRHLGTFANCAALPFIALMFFFYASVVGVEGARVSGWIWEFHRLSDTWRFLLLHYLVEFGLLAMLVPTIVRAGYFPGRLWWFGALTMFLLAPFYRMGEYNDFATKVILPAQFVFLLYLAMAIHRAEGPTQHLKRKLLIVLLCVGAIGPLGNLVRAYDFGLSGTPPPFDRVRHINEVEPRILAMQGKANPDSVFFRWFAATPVLQPTKPIRPVVVWDFTDPATYDPNIFIGFVDQAQIRWTEQGLHILTEGNRPLLRRDGVALDTRRIGKVRVRHQVLRDGLPVENHGIVFQWATPEQVAMSGDKWPFPKWQNNQAWPILRILGTNSFWRGVAQDVSFYFNVPGAGDERYEVIVSEIAFLER